MYNPLLVKNYSSIQHLSGSKMDKTDNLLSHFRQKIATLSVRDDKDRVIVQEKIDGSNVGVVKIDNVLYPITRSGLLAANSIYEQHWRFSNWVFENADRFYEILNNGERICGEWLMQAHGTRYELKHEPFVVFDIIEFNEERNTYSELKEKAQKYNFTLPHCIHNENKSLSLIDGLNLLGKYGKHGVIEPDESEGLIYRIETDDKFNFLTKYVKPNKINGKYLNENPPIWNWRP